MSKYGNTGVADRSEEVLASLMTFRADSSNLPMTADIELVARGRGGGRVVEAETTVGTTPGVEAEKVGTTPGVEPVEEETVTDEDVAE